MHVSKRILLCFLFICSFKHGAGSDSKRLAQLERRRDRSPSGLIPFNIEEFQDVVEAAPRSYSLFVMFSADSSLCQPCASTKRIIGMIAKEYYALPSSKSSSKPVFFAVVNVKTTDQEFLIRYGLRHVPVFYHFGRSKSKTYPKQLDERSADNYPVQAGLGANTLREFINSRCGSRLRVVRGNYQIPFVETVRMFKPFILFGVLAIAAVVVFTGAYKSPMLWFAVVMLIYIFSVGGGHYSWIHNSPLAVVNQHGVTEYIAGGSRSQYVAEGFFVSATCVSISILVILVQELPSVIPNKHGQTAAGLFFLFLTSVAITFLLTLYHSKMPQYLQYNELS
ncbi:putative dolichyl-diphosphooligosaccharide--protein glycosyltransferase subunit 3 [Gracilariopsis chorda]|uniref:Putative dolichyl-diphosphooligosaccharide--protein glycosyltransferase subunit 3 n=1 Tax=Gracilariopsis chorda TaxID=448386 RepID=A0A2V3J359_9FLOR|nr:putative dolichyl-diphosphooligosaccharide--protein glycosyltransferase subunit 3 [Gracilariopsis chorda]|eukprot:PXF48881.1 putative dolichyl-diphosphooligosaccharide--protein glycosyltransferase subunit 3 [Gracilariopsis chorda]